jgi:hypothetical protein
VVRVILTIGNDDVIHKMDAHELASLTDLMGEVVIAFAGGDTT